jgi:hypothetical protein
VRLSVLRRLDSISLHSIHFSQPDPGNQLRPTVSITKLTSLNKQARYQDTARSRSFTEPAKMDPSNYPNMSGSNGHTILVAEVIQISEAEIEGVEDDMWACSSKGQEVFREELARSLM